MHSPVVFTAQPAWLKSISSSVYLFNKKNPLCSWLALCFGCISFCVGWENVARWRVVNWWNVVYDWGSQWDCFNRLAVAFLWFVKSLHSQICLDLDFTISSSSSHILQNLLSKVEFFLACNTQRYATEWESSRQWIPFSYEMKVTESCDFRRLEQLTKKKPPLKFHLRLDIKKIQSKPRTWRGHPEGIRPQGPISILAGGRGACWRACLWTLGEDAERRIDRHTSASTFPQCSATEQKCLCCSELWVNRSEKPMSTFSMRLAPQSHYWTAGYFICPFSSHSMKLDVFTCTTGASSSTCK